MANAEILKKYLVEGSNPYLIDDNNNGKVIMLSGKWGSGKTHFWQNKIQTVLNEEENKIPNHYISLYGKTSIQEIKNEIFLKVFESVDSFKSEEKTKKIVKGSIDLVSSLTKSISVFGMSLDLSKITDKSFEKIDNLLNDEKLKRTENYLNSGAIICFDDFERKSKDIDLNDLFGFITQLTLNFNCKVVIILNDDVFEGIEKDVFSRVKEKSVSKLLKYEPSIKELFDLIFELKIEQDSKKEKKYKDLKPYREIIVKTIEETKELNARIYIQVLDNLVEWIEKNQDKSDDVLRCLILVNIHFVLYHTICNYKVENIYLLRGFYDIHEKYSNNFSERGIGENLKLLSTFQDYYSKLKESIFSGKEKPEEKRKYHNNFLESNLKNYESKFLANKLDISRNIDEETFQKINNFIETGILIYE